MVPGQPRLKKFTGPHLNRKSWARWYTSAILAIAGSLNRIAVHAGLDKKQNSISKTIKAKRAGGMVQVLENLASKHNVLSSNPSTANAKQTTIETTKPR
jgi:hypothetical protein